MQPFTLPKICTLITTSLLATICTEAHEPSPHELVDQYQGFLGRTADATGYFRTEMINDRWFLITPEGHPYITLGVNHVGNCFVDTKAYQPPSRFYTEFQNDREAAVAEVISVVKSLNFNSAGGYGPQLEELTKHLPYFTSIGYPEFAPARFNGYDKFAFDAFDPSVIEVFHKAIESKIKGVVEDPLCMGYYFIDIPFWNTDRVVYHRELPASAPGKQAYIQFLKDRHASDLQLIANTYGLKNVQTWDDLANSTFPKTNDENPVIIEDNEAFLGRVADQFYGMMRAGIDRLDPNRMMIGEKFVTGKVPLSVVRAIKPHIDIFAIQPLGGQNKIHCIEFPRELMDQYYEILQMPIILPDYAVTFPTEETPETHWHQLESEEAAAESYHNYLHAVFDTPYMIGVHRCELQSWFKRVKRRPHWRHGILDPRGDEYPVKAESVRNTNAAILDMLYQSLK